MKLPKFTLIAPDPADLPGAGYIQHNGERPFHLGRIVKYGNVKDMTLANANKPNFIQSQVTNYSIVIVLAGSVEGKIWIPADGSTAPLKNLIQEMAAWYYDRHISKNLNKFKQYLL